MIKSLGAIGIIAAGGLSICPLCGTTGLAGRAAPAHFIAALSEIRPATSVVTLRITGMTCGGCVLGVRTVLTRLDGVTKADVSYERANAIVHFDPARVSAAQMIAAIKTLGYTAVVVG